MQAGGGADGEHPDRLFASCARPFQSAFGDDPFPTDVDKAAVLFHGIIENHAFVDGNKRTATISAILFLVARGVTDDVTTLQLRLLGELALATASSNMRVDEVAYWLRRVLEREAAPR